MAVGLQPPAALLPVPGVELAVVSADIRGNGRGRDDLVAIRLSPGARSAVVLTRNAFAAAPVQLLREHRSAAPQPHALLINSGNANAGTGARGVADAQACCAQLAAHLGVPANTVWPFSTGVIGQALPMARLADGIDRLAGAWSADHWLPAARAIMTTDTVAKAASVTVDCGAQRYIVTGMAKGAGMIRPDMATMLAFVATDAPLSDTAVERLLSQATDASFHSISVDGDTSTNDACVLSASGTGPSIGPADSCFAVLRDAITQLMIDLAQRIVRDGEGATKFVAVRVSGARTRDEARRVGFSIAESPLVKTAWFASDANWGRMLAAVGNSGLEGLKLDQVALSVCSPAGAPATTMIQAGQPAADYDEAVADALFAAPEFCVDVSLGRGEAHATIWTCDLGHEYVRINAEYRT